MADRAEMRARMETYVAPLVAGLLALVTLVGLIGPAIQSPAPHDIPVGIVGAPQLAEQLAANAPGAFDFTNYDSEAAARAAIDSRDIDGAVVVGPGGPKLIIAGAAGDGVNGVITGVFTNVFKQQGQALAVETVHPFAAGDPHGLILFFVVLAVLVSTLIAQALVGLRRGLRFVTRLSAVVAGAASLLGRPGIALAALIVVLLDLVCSGGPIGSQLLPDAYRWLAPGMPAGQLYSAVRGTLYFDNAGIP